MTDRIAPRSAPRSEAGFSMVEVLVALALLGFALMSHAGTNVSGHRLTQAEGRHGVALQTLRSFTERLRSDVDWAGLYARLRDLLDEGTGYHAPSAYYDDFVVPSGLGTVRVRVDVPTSVPVGGGSWSPAVLREDVALTRFGLPYDLNGDGEIDNEARDGDYRALPVIVHFAWSAPGDAPQILKVATWLKGER